MLSLIIFSTISKFWDAINFTKTLSSWGGEKCIAMFSSTMSSTKMSPRASSCFHLQCIHALLVSLQGSLYQYAWYHKALLYNPKKYHTNHSKSSSFPKMPHFPRAKSTKYNNDTSLASILVERRLKGFLSYSCIIPFNLYFLLWQILIQKKNHLILPLHILSPLCQLQILIHCYVIPREYLIIRRDIY